MGIRVSGFCVVGVKGVGFWVGRSLVWVGVFLGMVWVFDWNRVGVASFSGSFLVEEVYLGSEV